ncbi:MAG: ATP-dependent DNA helicase RecG [Magnetospiraceae bacterium]
MRPDSLNPLFAETATLPGVGEKLARVLDKLTGPRVVDLIWHLPFSLIDRRYSPTVADSVPGRVATLSVTVDSHHPAPDRRRPYRVVCSDDTGFLTLVFFHAHGDYLRRVLKEGSAMAISGQVEEYNGERQMAHPDHMVPVAEIDSIRTVEPVYGLTAGISTKVLGKAVRGALDRLPNLPEWQDPHFLKRNAWPAWKEAVRTAHAPTEPEQLSPTAPARARLAYDELLANQLALALVRRDARRKPGREIVGDGRLWSRALAALPFALTNAQETAISEIRADQAAPYRMLRLLQGDVGSGKTVVALSAMLNAVEAGGQAVLMAPTEILARQHLATIAPLAEAAGVAVTLLTGREKGKSRATILAGLASGETALAVGTHAVFQADVAFRDLTLAVVDEQHRFGVKQRVTLAAKGANVDVLAMTATPIPRTLMLTAYGDMEVSRLEEKPPGRTPVDTRVLPLDRLEDVVGAVARAVDRGDKVFWVCPLVSESEGLEKIATAEDRHAHLTRRFGPRVGLVHGQLKAKEKDTAMAAFAGDGADILVATTVIEVGVDVPAASVMVIEHAERFGLAQLHQLRGRIGRGSKGGTCLLLYAAPLSQTADARLRILRETEDGFRIAEEDLKLRGAGEVLGTRQSGLPAFRLADLDQHADLLPAARDDVALILNENGDPDLTGPRGQALRALLYLFERDAAVRLLGGG